MEVRIALVGNPNSGKTTMFNHLTGSTQRVGNWPGVTVEKKEGRLKGHKEVFIQDLPGIYSLSPYTLEEVVTRNYLIGEKPDVILNIIDSANLERNLYLTTQLLETGIPVVIALNMMDIVRKSGDVIDVKRLSESLGCPIVETAAVKGEGCVDAALLAAEIAAQQIRRELPPVFGGTVEHAIAHIEDTVKPHVPPQQLRWYAIKLFERDEKVMEQLALPADEAHEVAESIEACEREMDDDTESIITNERYAYISKLMTTSLKKKQRAGNLSTSDKIDRVVTNRWLALPIFIVVMIAIYYIAVTSVGTIVTDFTNDTLFGEWIVPGVTTLMENAGAAGWLVSLIADGIIGGVGAVLGFVPQMLVLFILLAILEDIGYMARVAFIMDRIFRRFGLSGKSFIPMLIGSGCSVPGIMASRTIESERDRRMTIMTTSFIPCGAKMPIVGLIAAAVFGGTWWVAPSAYVLGVAAVLASGIILKKTKLFAGDPAPFVMELPAYHAPTVGNVLRNMWERGWSFIKRAGTVILLASIIIWFLAGFGWVDGSFGMVADINDSILAPIGGFIAPIFTPLGFGGNAQGGWEPTVATIMGLVAKEEVVGVFGVLTSIGDADLAFEMVDAANTGALGPIAGLFASSLAAYCFLIFNLLCAPCFAAMGAIRREMNSGKWTAFAIAYLCVFAYAIALIVFQLGSLFTGGGFTVATAVALVVLAGLLFLLFRPDPGKKRRLTTRAGA